MQDTNRKIIERKEKDGVSDEKNDTFGVFVFYAKKIKPKIRQYLFIA